MQYRVDNPKSGTKFFRINHRLVLLHKASDHLKYWEDYWRKPTYLQSLIKKGLSGNLGEFNKIIFKHVSKGGKVLEAGCGPGHLVAGLSATGYQAMGIDYEPAVIQFANTHLPQEKIALGNILEIDLSDNTLDCYLSVGVVEHFIDGPLPALQEARRVLQPNGVALISVPYLNPARKQLFDILEEKPIQEGYHFHQYYFSVEEFTSLLYQAGFTVIDLYPYAVEAFLTREHSIFKRIWKSPHLPYRIQKLVLRYLQNAPSGIRQRYGHMLMFVSKPRQLH